MIVNNHSRVRMAARSITNILFRTAGTIRSDDQSVIVVLLFLAGVVAIAAGILGWLS